MPDFLAKYLIYAAIIATLCSASFVKGCQHGEANGEAEKAAAILLAEKQKAQWASDREKLISAHSEKEKNDEKARTDLAAANLGLRQSIAGYRRSAPFTVASDPECPANKLLESCGRTYEEVAIRGAERIRDCSQELASMAGAAETERGKAELAGSLYNSIRNRSPK